MNKATTLFKNTFVALAIITAVDGLIDLSMGATRFVRNHV